MKPQQTNLILQPGDSAGRFSLRGEMDFSSVVPLVFALRPALSGESQVSVDLGGIERSNSAGLGLLLEWLKQARQLDCELRFHNIPQKLLAIAETCALEGIISTA